MTISEQPYLHSRRPATGESSMRIPFVLDQKHGSQSVPGLLALGELRREAVTSATPPPTTRHLLVEPEAEWRGLDPAMRRDSQRLMRRREACRIIEPLISRPHWA
jgi:hypothetical protein